MRIGSCHICEHEIEEEFFLLCEIRIATQTKVQVLSIMEFKDLLEIWLSKKFYHLSASEIILLRPDIVNQFVLDMMGEKAIWFTEPFYVCTQCFEHWKKAYPER